MTVKEAKIRLQPLGTIDRIIEVPFFYTDEFKETDLYDFAYSSAIKDWLPYIFAGYFSDGKDFNKWYFSNARRHEEMREGVEQVLSRIYSYTPGQISLERVRKGPLQFHTLILHSDIPDREKAIRLLLGVISPRWLSKDFNIRLVNEGSIWRLRDQAQVSELK